MRVDLAIEWREAPGEGELEVRFGQILVGAFPRAEGTYDAGRFRCIGPGRCRLVLSVDASQIDPGARATTITVRTSAHAFTFFVRDVRAGAPMWVRPYGVVITLAHDYRSYDEIVATLTGRGWVTGLQRIDLETEESAETAARHTRALRCPIWLGVSRHMQLFEMDVRGNGRPGPGSHLYEWIQPRFPGEPVRLEETKGEPCWYGFLLGRGWGCTSTITRALEAGCLPIFRAAIVDDDVQYQCTAFATLEATSLSAETLRGTHFLVADGHCAGHVFTPEHEELFATLLAEELGSAEEIVLVVLVHARNTAAVPRYACFKAPAPGPRGVRWSFDGAHGFGLYESGRVFCVAKLNGAPLPQEEMAILLQPGETAVLEFVVPHRPISWERAMRLVRRSGSACLEEARRFWQGKLHRGGRMLLPEERLNQMVQAGLLHLDLITFGREPDGTLAPAVGVYSPIGSESAPIIQFLDSMGWHDVARRAVTYFLDKQHEDGFIQNFTGYQLETGCALWTLGEHYRYTRDDRWVGEIATKLLKSCEYLIAWRRRNQREDLRGRGYGLIDGRVGDPDDVERSFMLNGYAYLGLRRAAEMLEKVEPAASQRLAAEAEAWKQDIRTALFETLARGPIVPLADGGWYPTASPWAGHWGPVSLLAEGGTCYTHGAITCRDALTGPLYLVFQEVLEPDEPATDILLHVHHELFCSRNVGFSQPYYSPHPFIHLKRDEVKPFLKAYYNGFSGLADRETFTFWEHYFGGSPHKTHEEAWFLMQTRWMLYMEEGDTLKLLRGIPRMWLAPGQRIVLERVASYFGPLSLTVESDRCHDRIVAELVCNTDRHPAVVDLRLPHSQGRRPVSARGATYDAAKETARIIGFSGRASVVLDF